MPAAAPHPGRTPGPAGVLAALLVAAALTAPAAVSLAGAGPGASPADRVLVDQAARCLASGQWLLQWAPDPPRGHGSPLFLFRPPLAYYPAALLRLAGLPPGAAAGTTQAAGLLASGLFFFLLGRRLWGGAAGALAALAAVHVPARLWPALGAPELAPSLALAWAPLSLWGAARFAGRRDGLSWALAAGGLAGLLLTDRGAALLLAPALLGCGAALAAASATGRALAGAAAAAAGLGAFHWLPAWLEAVHLGGPPAEGPLPALPPAWSGPAGWAVLALGGAALARAVARPRAPLPWRGLWWTSLALALVSLPVLAGGPGLGSLPGPAIQGPHDPSLPLAMLLPLALAPLARALPPAVRAGSVALAALLLGGTMLAPTPDAALPPRPLRPPIPRWTERLPPAGGTGRFLPPPGCRLDQVRPGSHRHFLDAVCSEGGLLEARVLYFPGWTAEVNKRRVELEPHPPHGRLALQLPAGAHRIKLELEETPPRTAGRFLSLATLVAAAAAWAARRRP